MLDLCWNEVSHILGSVIQVLLHLKLSLQHLYLGYSPHFCFEFGFCSNKINDESCINGLSVLTMEFKVDPVLAMMRGRPLVTAPNGTCLRPLLFGLWNLFKLLPKFVLTAHNPSIHEHVHSRGLLRLARYAQVKLFKLILLLAWRGLITHRHLVFKFCWHVLGHHHSW